MKLQYTSVARVNILPVPVVLVVAVVNIVLVVRVRRVPLGRRVPVHNINLVLDHRQAM